MRVEGLSHALSTSPLSPHRAVFSLRDRDAGVLVSDRTSVCILGAGCHAYPLAPADEDTWEVWSCNALWRLAFDGSGRIRADRWFELHPLFAQTQKDRVLLNLSPIDVYVLEASDREWVPLYIRYPFDRIRHAFQTTTSAFSSTFAYQMALALLLGMRTIRLVGVHMEGGREALVERPNLLYWIGVANGMGVEVQIDDMPFSRPLLKTPFLYGYHYTQEKEYVESYCRDAFPSIARDGWRGSR